LKETGKIDIDKYVFIYSEEQHHHVVGFLMKRIIASSMKGFWSISDRLVMAKFEAQPFDIKCI
jgi:hypothetical protein